MGTDQSSIKTHLANNRTSQPLRYGGLAFPDPIIQTQALNFSWARKLQNSSSDLSWVKLIEKKSIRSIFLWVHWIGESQEKS